MKKTLKRETKKNDKTNYENKKAKIDFYIISLMLLFILIIIITLDIPTSMDSQSMWLSIKELLRANIIPLIALGFLTYGFIAWRKFKYKFKGTPQLPVRILEIENIDFEHLTFLTTYIIPLVGIDIRELRYFIVFVVLIISIGCIYIKTDLFYANPTLSLLGYHIYRVETDSKDISDSVFISYGKVNKNESVQYYQLDEKIFYVRRTNR